MPVEAGNEIAATFSLHNVSSHAVRAPVENASPRLVVRAGDGTKYDTQTAVFASGSLGGPYRPPITIQPGATRTMLSPRVLVRWKGPLRVTPVCEKKALPALRVKVVAPGPPNDVRTAISNVVGATGGLLDDCRPEKPGVAVDGTIRPPTGGGPSMQARCSLTVQPEGRFLVAQVLVRIPRDLRGLRVRQPYETLTFAKHRRPYAAIAWELVVTRDGAVTVAGYTHDATRAGKRMAPEWFWSGSGWGQPGSAKCGGEGFSNWPELDLISVCP